MNNDYSFSVASLEIIIALGAAFILGALLCAILRLIGRLFRGKPEPETQPQAEHHTQQVHLDRTPANNNARGGFQADFPTPRPIPPVIERQPPMIESENAPVSRLVEGGATYEADIDTLLRRNSSVDNHSIPLPENNGHSNGGNSFADRARASLGETISTTAPVAAAASVVIPTSAASRPAPAPAPAASPAFRSDLEMPADDHVDDLKKLEGIGPNIESLLNRYGIRSYARLATVDREHLREMLASGGNEFRMHDPKSWPYQAELAAKQNWDRLREYQEFLIEGRGHR